MIMCAAFPLDIFFLFLMIRRPPRSTQGRSSAASDVYKRQVRPGGQVIAADIQDEMLSILTRKAMEEGVADVILSLIHISEPTRPY